MHEPDSNHMTQCKECGVYKLPEELNNDHCNDCLDFYYDEGQLYASYQRQIDEEHRMNEAKKLK